VFLIKVHDGKTSLCRARELCFGDVRASDADERAQDAGTVTCEDSACCVAFCSNESVKLRATELHLRSVL